MASGGGDVFISRRRVSTLQALMPRGGDDAAGLPLGLASYAEDQVIYVWMAQLCSIHYDRRLFFFFFFRVNQTRREIYH